MPELSINKSEAPKNISIDENTDSKSREIACSPIFRDFKMFLFRVKYMVFWTKISTLSRFWKNQVDRTD